MEAPNKIYLEKSLSFPDKLHSHWYKEDIVGNGVEYIRKDALLEWLKERKRLMEEEIGFRLSIDDVIDKLNSL